MLSASLEIYEMPDQVTTFFVHLGQTRTVSVLQTMVLFLHRRTDVLEKALTQWVPMRMLLAARNTNAIVDGLNDEHELSCCVIRIAEAGNS